MQAVAAIVISAYPSFMGWDTVRAEEWFDSPGARLAMVFLFELLSVGTIYLFIRYYLKRSFRELVGLKRMKWFEPLIAPAAFIAYLILFMIVFTLVDNFLPIVDTAKEQVLGFDHESKGLALLMAFVSLCVLPPIAEEILFRGFLYGAFRSNKVPFIVSTIITSGIFGFLHLFGAESGLLWIAFIDTFLLSVILCVIRERTGSIWACIGLHMIKNGFVFLNLFVINAS